MPKLWSYWNPVTGLARRYVQWRNDDHREFKQDNGINFRNKKLNNRKIMDGKVHDPNQKQADD